MGTKVHNNYEDLITFTRASGGHALRPVSYGSELVTNGTFDSDVTSWPSSSATFVTDNSDPYEGDNSALLTASGGAGRAVQNVTTEVGKLYRLSCFVKYNSGDTSSVEIFEVVENNSQTLVTSSDTDWRQLSYNFVATSTTSQIRIRERGTNDNASFFIDNVSLKEVTFDESGGTLTLFEHPNNVPRVEYDADSNRLGLLIEEARTNLFTYSLLLTEYWSKNNASLSANQATAPDGTLTASEMIPTASANQSFINLNRSVTSGTTYTQSIFVKQKDTSWFQIAPSTGFAASYQNFNIATGSLGSGDVTSNDGSASIQNVGNGWYRCSVTMPCNATESAGRMVFVYMTGDDGRINTDGTSTPDGTEGVYVWGAQLEEGSFPTSYIKTTGSTATRSADTVEISGDVFGLNDKEGTMVVEFDQTYVEGGTGFPRAVELGNDSTSVQRCNIYITESTNRLTAALNTNNVNQGILALNTSLTGTLPMTKVAYGFADNNLGASDNGDTALTDTAADFSGATNKRNQITFGTSSFVGHIKSFKYYPRRLTNAQLEDLSS